MDTIYLVDLWILSTHLINRLFLSQETLLGIIQLQMILIKLHIINLRQYIGLTSTQPPEATWHKQELVPLGQGLGLCGLPGDFLQLQDF